MAKEFKNKEVHKLPNDSSFNDYDKLHDTLISLKELNTVVGTFKTEASCKELVTMADNFGKKVFDKMRKSFDLMFENGWYTLEEADKVKVTQAYGKFEQRKKELLTK